jgi:hypothetical protein
MDQNQLEFIYKNVVQPERQKGRQTAVVQLVLSR